MSDGSQDTPPPALSEKPQPTAAERPPIWESQVLLQGHPEAWIVHGEHIYRLRITASGKLYLTK